MIKEKKIVLVRRLIGLAVILIGTIVTGILNVNPLAFALITALFVILVTFMHCKCKTYYYNGKQIVVYVGYLNNYLMIDGEKVDERKTFESWVPIYLTCEAEDIIVEATISTSKFIATKIDGKLVRPASFFEKEIKNGDNNI